MFRVIITGWIVHTILSRYYLLIFPYSGFFSDVSSNSIMGEIPYGLPPNATHMYAYCSADIVLA
jgi:hypothetical protein